MKEILTHPSAGYYMTRDVFGQAGDFVTSPEISQLFGELIAVWIVNEYKKIDEDSLQIIELGPGRGTLMNDMLRIFEKLKISNRISVHLVEISPVLSAIQAKNLCGETEETKLEENTGKEDAVKYYRKGRTKNGIDVFWYYRVNDVPRKFSAIVAHEFFDAMPVRKFQKTPEGWREIMVDIVQGTEEEKFRYVLSSNRTIGEEVFIPENEERSHIEVSPESMLIMEHISKLLYENGGFGLIIDYGHSGEKTDTFRAFRRHEQCDPLLNPGSADLTADVDFSALTRVATNGDKLITFGPISQQKFLYYMGINFRMSQLLKNATEEQKQQIVSGYDMLMNEEKMGTRFKAFSFFPAVLKYHLEKFPVAGFIK